MSIIPDDRKVSLTPSELARYGRHLLLPEIGLEGQKRLKAARVLVAGAGGLGAPIAMYLAAAGVGTLGILDCDSVDASNLQRQIIHGTGDIGRFKTAAAKARIFDINPFVNVVQHNVLLDRENALEIIGAYDLVCDGTDNFPTRYLINDVCAMLGKPDVYGAVFRTEGQASVFYARQGACYRCLYPSPPPPEHAPSCADAGVLGALTGIIGTVQATEAVKLITGGGKPLIGRLLVLDAWQMTFREFEINKNKACPLCGENPTVTELPDYGEFCGINKREALEYGISLTELKARIAAGEKFRIIDTETRARTLKDFPDAEFMTEREIISRAETFSKDIPVAVICLGGKRSAEIILRLKDAGYPGELYSLIGGLKA
jgi:adenylyltransferase/sulfurtransferase